MLTRRMLALLASTFTLAGSAQADIFASGPVYGGFSQGGTAICRIFNAGLTNVTISGRQIRTNINTTLTPSADTCNVVLASGNYCSYQAAIPGNFAISCRVTAVGTDVRIRGRAEVQSSTGVVLVGQPID